MPSPQADDPNVIRGPATLGPGIVPMLLDTLQTATRTQVEKPWGGEDIWDCGIFLLKVIFVDEGQSTSLQHHEIKEEVQLIANADDTGGVYVYTALGADADEVRKYGEGEVVRIMPGTIHRTVGPCVLIEVTTPENDDVVRHQDKYGRLTSDDIRKTYVKPTLTRGKKQPELDPIPYDDPVWDEPPGYSAGIQELGYEGDG